MVFGNLGSTGAGCGSPRSGRVSRSLRSVVLAGAVLVAMLATAPGLVMGDVRAQGAGNEVSELRTRVEQLEEQLVDMQVVVGTLQSLAGGGGGGARVAAPAGVPVSGDAGVRLQLLETQMQALAGQMAALTAEVRGTPLTAGAGAGAGAFAGAAAGANDGSGGFGAEVEVAQPDAGAGQGSFGGWGISTNSVDRQALPDPAAPSSGGDAIAGALAGGGIAAGGAGGATVLASRTPDRSETAEQTYERAYGHLLQQDYGAAQSAFEEFVQRYPDNELAGNAQFWLGETHYVRGQYRDAARAFLSGYKSYGEGSKAPDSLLKLAMSLSRLGQKPAACSTFDEFSQRFPSAPSHIRRRAAAERDRTGC